MSEAPVQQPPVIKELVRIDERGLVLDTADKLWRHAQMVHKSGLCPESLKSPEQVYIALIRGRELGMSAQQAVESIVVIANKTTMYAKVKKALVISSGECDDWEEKFTGSPGQPDYTCVVRVKRKGHKSYVETSFSLGEAQTAGLFKRNPTYQTYPGRMLRSRAVGWAADDAFPDVLMGMPTYEDVRDYEAEPTVPRETAAPAGTSASDLLKQAIAPPVVTKNADYVDITPETFVTSDPEPAAPSQPEPQPEPTPVEVIEEEDMESASELLVRVHALAEDRGIDPEVLQKIWEFKLQLPNQYTEPMAEPFLSVLINYLEYTLADMEEVNDIQDAMMADETLAASVSAMVEGALNGVPLIAQDKKTIKILTRQFKIKAKQEGK